MLKHGLITEKAALAPLLSFDTNTFNLQLLAEMLKESVEIKENIVEQEETYIIPRLNIAIKEYDKGNLENICRKLEEYLDADENRGKSEIVIL